ncbi:hypothetical protein P7K49_002682 [Saguinus oedipus]|uniref:Uncharacterized protein n=1 Tax=Saguinus oedipus TaxID=9490 RepID=A0ABQ9WJ01_SAGOE|nr:hypothetical protein P7K49_002682 [Saguinus oedipus]
MSQESLYEGTKFAKRQISEQWRNSSEEKELGCWHSTSATEKQLSHYHQLLSISLALVSVFLLLGREPCPLFKDVFKRLTHLHRLHVDHIANNTDTIPVFRKRTVRCYKMESQFNPDVSIKRSLREMHLLPSLAQGEKTNTPERFKADHALWSTGISSL